jgi:ribosomal protein L20A (L18A)
MAESRYSVSGLIRNRLKFDIEVNAKSERHARALAVIKIGSSQRLKRNSIKITGIKQL